MTPVFWLILIIALVIVEAMTMGLTTIWFAIGGVAGFIASLFHLTLLPQWLIFAAVSLVLMIAMRPIAKRALKTEEVRTNVDAVIGKQAIVTKEISNLAGTGEVSLNGNYWSARSAADTEILAPGEKVIVQAVTGVKLVVKKEA